MERSLVMAAPASDIFAQVDDLAAWDRWSPWAKLDPQAKTTISDPSSGEGANFAWNGNDDVGEGSLTIVDSRPDSLVELEQVFVRPLAGRCRMKFLLVPQDDGTKVTWRMDGTNSFIAKAICLVMDMDATLGPNFEQGLAGIKSVVEKPAAPAAGGP
ncbi:MAG: SRPBCC family protein [Pirellulales bacterium]